MTANEDTTPLPGHTKTDRSPTWIAWSRDGKRLAHGLAGSNKVFVRDGASAAELTQFTCDAQPIHGSWSPDGTRIAVTEVGRTTIRDCNTGTVLLANKRPGVQFAVWHPIREQIAIDGGDDVEIVDARTLKTLQSHSAGRRVFDVAWRSDGAAIVAYDTGVRAFGTSFWERWTGGECTTVAVASNGTVAIASNNIVVVIAEKRELRLEHHSAPLRALTFSGDAQLLASRDTYGTVAVWDTQTWKLVAKLTAGKLNSFYSMEFNPKRRILACTGDDALLFHHLGANIESNPLTSVQYTTAKIALVGDSGVGKTGLGWRLAYGFFKEHPSTHGEQFWLADRLSTVRNDHTRCEAVIWDLAGQPDYRLIHSLFVDDADVALIVFDPTNHQEPLKGAEYWLQTLARSRDRRTRTILVAARIDRGPATLTQDTIDAFAAAHDIAGGYIATSAQRGDGLEELIQRIATLINWEQRPATVTLETFKEIKDHVLEIKQMHLAADLLVTVDQLQRRLSQSSQIDYKSSDIFTATKHLADHGFVRHLRSSTGTRFVLLSPDLLNNLAASMILEARGNPKGLGALDERRVLTGEYSFPELEPLSRRDREVLLDAATTLFIEHNVCFRETLGADTFLIFPSLINQNKPPIDDGRTFDGTAYTATGATENVYASLVVLLGYTNTFTRTNQWRDQAQYEMGDRQICGFRMTEEREGQIDLVLYFGDGATPSTRQLFQGLFEKFLLSRPVEVQIFPPVHCAACSYVQPRSEVVKRQRETAKFLFCSNCGNRVLLPPLMLSSKSIGGAQEPLEHEEKIAAIRTQFEKAITWLKSYLRDTSRETSPSCFISYAWGNEAHERWVERNLATDLRNAGVEVVLDRWQNNPGTSISRFIDQIERVTFVVMIGTPRLREKYDSTTSDPVVAGELKLVNTRLRSRSDSEYVIPLLLEGEQKTSFPPLAADSVFIDFRVENDYFERMFDLLLTLYRIPFGEPAMRDLRDTIRDAADQPRRR